MKKINTINEFEEIINKKVLVDFYADWCGPCRMLKPVLERIENDLDYEIVEVNVDELRQLAMKYKVMSIPNLKIFNNNKIEKETTGLKTEQELKDFLGI